MERDLDRAQAGRARAAAFRIPCTRSSTAAGSRGRSGAREARACSGDVVAVLRLSCGTTRGSTRCWRRGRKRARVAARAPRWWSPVSSTRRRSRTSQLAAGGRRWRRAHARPATSPDDEVEALFQARPMSPCCRIAAATQSGVTHVAYALGVPVIATDGRAASPRPCVEGETGLTSRRPRIRTRSPRRSCATSRAACRDTMARTLPSCRRATRGRQLAAATRGTLIDETAPRSGAGRERADARPRPATRPRLAARWLALARVSRCSALTGGGRIVGQRRGHHVRARARACSTGHIDGARRRDGAAVRTAASTARTPRARRCWRCRWWRPPRPRHAAAAHLSRAEGARSASAVRRLLRSTRSLAALVLAALYVVRRAGWGCARARRTRPRQLMLGFTTPLWVYAKSFMAEPLEVAGPADGAGQRITDGRRGRPRTNFPRRASSPRRSAGARRVLLAVSRPRLSMLPLAMVLACSRLGDRAFAAATCAGSCRSLGIALAVAGPRSLYDVRPLRQPCSRAGYGGAGVRWPLFRRRCWVGRVRAADSPRARVSSWFAPAILARNRRARTEMSRSARVTYAHESRGMAGVRVRWHSPRAASLLDVGGRAGGVRHGSSTGPATARTGPRYLVPLLPLGIPRWWRSRSIEMADACVGGGCAWALRALAGLLVTLGGVGDLLRGRDALRRATTLTRWRSRIRISWSRSHFNPRFSPIAACNWRMLAARHSASSAPAPSCDSTHRARPARVDPRLGVSGADTAANSFAARARRVVGCTRATRGCPVLPLALAALALAGFGAIVRR